ncbi:hypothetical protein [Lewinella sp. 4G2]|uniref:hypothetical protein n=1 Tax=Lewinella sp. 4G2 TaxID=1803372 RepID=UPI0007B4C6BA|nr:hypothetical protein [Lewinella sp. 4G2]OAV44029.1 hypothetical protein A3850_005750 [Lewinella sp. 4G2]
MYDYRLAYFYNLSITVLLGMYVFSRISTVIKFPDDPYRNIVYLIAALPSAIAAYHFWQQYQERRELSVREGVFILTAVQIATNMIGWFLR